MCVCFIVNPNKRHGFEFNGRKRVAGAAAVSHNPRRAGWGAGVRIIAREQFPQTKCVQPATPNLSRPTRAARNVIKFPEWKCFAITLRYATLPNKLHLLRKHR